MAKGFTVKAKAPTKKKEQEWDYDKAREMVKGKAIVGRGILYNYTRAINE